MMSYFIRRLLLVPLTFMCITLLVYLIVVNAPGGPIEQAQLQAQQNTVEGGAGGGGIIDDVGTQMSDEELAKLKAYYKLDKPNIIGYLIWIGLLPDEHKGGSFSGILQGDFGKSNRYGDPVLATIVSKFPISIYFGLIGYLLTWLICIPLGVYKAIKHRSHFDTASSIVVFLGYSVPGFVAALGLMLTLATDNFGLNWFPMGDFRSKNWDAQWDKGEVWWCIKDQIHHTIIPITGYVLAGFATMTLLMKNSLLDNLGADYVRTAFAKGLGEKRVIFVHALRNSLIPICVGIGHAIGLLFAGSFLIEKTCNIRGMGMLGFESLVQRDYPVLMGILTFGVILRLLGNIVSDVVLAVVDPRVRFS